ncbi:unnamed protein product [Parnassius apollo]|uniref:(apollo) hypothetical protein n=1 Tax=Parnassius apollo TaxID=110799 RepID=A0A8S3YCG1_PARAO|nr:unnamed protein product [Parnassius apollo]
MAVENKITIKQKYLEVGHTQMKVDAMHSLIERRMRNRIINVPADYVQIIESTRNNPFDVTYLEHTFFKDFRNISSYKSIRPERSSGDPKVTDIHALMYSSSGEISYKLRFEEPWMLLAQRKSPFSAKSFEEMQNLHQTRLKTKARKYDGQQISENFTTIYRMIKGPYCLC